MNRFAKSLSLNSCGASCLAHVAGLAFGLAFGMPASAQTLSGTMPILCGNSPQTFGGDFTLSGNVTVRVQTTNGGTGANNVGRINLTQLWSGSAWSSIGNSKITGTLGNVQVTKVGASGGGHSMP